MVKGNPKSSASSATRKKHAKKHAPPEDTVQNTSSKKGGKKTKEPRVKMYIPPVKPAPVQPDPLDTTGLAHSLPADLLVLLRNLSKKASVTKVRALEELQAVWVDRCVNDRDEALVYTLVEMLPVWLHHLPAMLVNPSRRVRFVAASLHSSFMRILEVHEQTVFFLRETASSSQVENILGAWCLAAHDVDRSVASIASKTWEETIITSSKVPDGSSSSSTKHLFLDDTTRSSLTSFIQRAALDPGGVYLYLNPVTPVVQPVAVHPFQSKKGSAKGSQVPTPKRDDGGDQTPRSKGDEQEESEQDRKARLRIGALGALKWILGITSSLSEDLMTLYSNRALWTSLSPHEVPTWLNMDSFGFGQPNVRKAAWGLVQSLLSSHQGIIASLIPIFSTVVLRSAWVELDAAVQAVMWQPLLTFLKQFPRSWISATDDALDSEDEGEDVGVQATKESKKPSEAYQEFLQYLELGCSGSPIQGYPIVVVVLSTIPPSIFCSSSEEPLSQFFTSFWAAVDGRAMTSLHRTAASSAFLSSLLESMVFLVRRIQSSDENLRLTKEDGVTLVKEQFSRVWTELSTTQKLKMEERTLATLVAHTLKSLMGVNQALFSAAWEVLANDVKELGRKDGGARLVSGFLKSLMGNAQKKEDGENGKYLKETTGKLLGEILTITLQGVEAAIRSLGDEKRADVILMAELMDQFKDKLFFDESFNSKLDDLLLEHAFRFLSVSPTLLLSYLRYRENEETCLAVWHSLLGKIAATQAADLTSTKKLLETTQKGNLPRYLKPRRAELDSVFFRLLEKTLTSPTDSDEAVLIKQILMSPGYFLSTSGYDSALRSITSAYTSHVQHVLEGIEVPMSFFDVTISLIETVFDSIVGDDNLGKALLPDIFLFAYLVPKSLETNGVDQEPTPSQVSARGLWAQWLQSASEVETEGIATEVLRRLKEFMPDTKFRSLPQDILGLLAQQPPGLHVSILIDIFPSPEQLDAMLDGLSPDPNDPSLAVLGHLLPPMPTAASKNKIKKPISADRHGFAPYARIVNGLSYAFLEDRQLARRNLWALRHLLSLSVYAQDLKNVPSSWDHASPLFDGKITENRLEEVVGRVKQISVYLFNSINASDRDEGVWRRVVVERFLGEVPGRDVPREGLSDSQLLLFDAISHAKTKDAARDARVLRIVLESMLADGLSDTEADLWVQLARKLEKTASETSMNIISLLTSRGAETPRLDRYRNELASSLLGIKPQRVNTEGLLALRRLAASAPNADGDVASLPTPRAVNVVKALQTWALADVEDDEDEMNEEVESAMLPIFENLAPILQSVSGSHWPFVFDVVEGVLERALGPEGEDEKEADSQDDEEERIRKKMEDGTMLVAIARALRLVLVIEELAKTNKSFMEVWKERRKDIMKSIVNLRILRRDEGHRYSKPFSACRELVLTLLKHLQSASPLIDESTLPKMIHLFEDSSYKVQKMAYPFLKTAAMKRTEHFIIEAGVVSTGDDEDEVKPVLPVELLEILRKEVNFEGESDEEQVGVFAYLLVWMIVFDSLVDTSFKVRSSYIDQLRKSNLVLETFIPCLLNLLGLDRGGLAKSFKLDVWGLDVFYIDLYEPGSPHTIPVLAAHVYYRALLTIPSLIHNWVLECKDRQLTNAVTTYTSSYFSPVLIRAELEHVRTNAAGSELVDEKMNVKVVSTSASGGGAPPTGQGLGGEVVASYLVDEQQLEIRIRIPSDWPLHKVEVKDVKRVGVDEKHWRAWVLGVQQTIWAHNGRIVDGLGHFKRNATLHFEGQVECAICYSIISVMDGSLPKRPCKTCKNRFHAACLYKWFNTSHSSSCPLCRSDIM